MWNRLFYKIETCHIPVGVHSMNIFNIEPRNTNIKMTVNQRVIAQMHCLRLRFDQYISLA